MVVTLFPWIFVIRDWDTKCLISTCSHAGLIYPIVHHMSIFACNIWDVMRMEKWFWYYRGSRTRSWSSWETLRNKCRWRGEGSLGNRNIFHGPPELQPPQDSLTFRIYEAKYTLNEMMHTISQFQKGIHTNKKQEEWSERNKHNSKRYYFHYFIECFSLGYLLVGTKKNGLSVQPNGISIVHNIVKIFSRPTLLLEIMSLYTFSVAIAT